MTSLREYRKMKDWDRDFAICAAELKQAERDFDRQEEAYTTHSWDPSDITEAVANFKNMRKSLADCMRGQAPEQQELGTCTTRANMEFAHQKYAPTT
jgi:hypothetical protein